MNLDRTTPGDKMFSKLQSFVGNRVCLKGNVTIVFEGKTLELRAADFASMLTEIRQRRIVANGLRQYLSHFTR